MILKRVHFDDFSDESYVNHNMTAIPLQIAMNFSEKKFENKIYFCRNVTNCIIEFYFPHSTYYIRKNNLLSVIIFYLLSYNMATHFNLHCRVTLTK